MQQTRKTVVVTGASSGIGRACVSSMSRAAWQVFATVRKPGDKEALLAENLAGVLPVILDVEDRTSILAAADHVASQIGASGLDGLVNVAGIGMVRPLEYATPHDLQKIFGVNAFGQMEVIQAFLPLLRKKRGRIVNISSVGAHIAIPFGGLLNASKSAFGILSDTLRLELHPFGIHVSTIEPGAIATPAVDKTLGDIGAVIAALPELGRARYAGMLTNFTRRAYEREKHGSPPEVVAQAVHHALTAARPHIRYCVGKHARLLVTLPRILPGWLLEKILFQITGLPSRFGATQDETEQSLPRAA